MWVARVSTAVKVENVVSTAVKVEKIPGRDAQVYSCTTRSYSAEYSAINDNTLSLLPCVLVG